MRTFRGMAPSRHIAEPGMHHRLRRLAIAIVSEKIFRDPATERGAGCRQGNQQGVKPTHVHSGQ
jgi:hypothetical protein